MTESETACKIIIGDESVTLGPTLVDQLCRHSMYVKNHLGFLRQMEPNNKLPTINLSPDMFSKDLFLAFLGCNRISRDTDLVVLLYAAGFLQISESYIIHLLLNPMPYGNKSLIPALFLAIYRFEMGKLAHHLLQMLGFDYIPKQLLCQAGYSKFRHYIRKLLRSDTRFDNLFTARPYRYQSMLRHCSCARCTRLSGHGARVHSVQQELHGLINDPLHPPMPRPLASANPHYMCPICFNDGQCPGLLSDLLA